jgi:hypothetical protein
VGVWNGRGIGVCVSEGEETVMETDVMDIDCSKQGGRKICCNCFRMNEFRVNEK